MPRGEAFCEKRALRAVLVAQAKSQVALDARSGNVTAPSLPSSPAIKDLDAIRTAGARTADFPAESSINRFNGGRCNGVPRSPPVINDNHRGRHRRPKLRQLSVPRSWIAFQAPLPLPPWSILSKGGKSAWSVAFLIAASTNKRPCDGENGETSHAIPREPPRRGSIPADVSRSPVFSVYIYRIIIPGALYAKRRGRA